MNRHIQKYINLYSYKSNTQNALWQRYTNGRLFLGGVKQEGDEALACAVIKKCDFYATKS